MQPQFTRYKITLFCLTIFAIVALVVVGADSYRLIMGMATEYSAMSSAVVTALVGFFSGAVSAYIEAKKQDEDSK